MDNPYEGATWGDINGPNLRRTVDRLELNQQSILERVIKLEAIILDAQEQLGKVMQALTF